MAEDWLCHAGEKCDQDRQKPLVADNFSRESQRLGSLNAILTFYLTETLLMATGTLHSCGRNPFTSLRPTDKLTFAPVLLRLPLPPHRHPLSLRIFDYKVVVE